MATEEQIAANRRNAQSSSGPTSAAGKEASRMNAFRHGLTGHIDITSPEEQEAKDKFCGEIIASLAALPGIEHQFAHSIAEDHWRLNRARTIENNIFVACSYELDPRPNGDPAFDKAISDSSTFIKDPHRFQLLTIYEQRIHRNMSKNLQQLTALQAIRRDAQAEYDAKQNALREKALEEACLLAQLAEMEGVPYDPAIDFPEQIGFVLSTAEITRAIRRASRLKLARSAESSDWNPTLRRAA